VLCCVGVGVGVRVGVVWEGQWEPHHSANDGVTSYMRHPMTQDGLWHAERLPT
jgi:hypothetical protein